MSDPDEHSPLSNYFCHNCGRTNTNGPICPQCQSQFVEEVPPPAAQDTNDQQVPFNDDFRNPFNPSFDIQLFTNILLPMLMSQIQANLPQQRSRRGRPPRRIKRVAHRYLPLFDLSSSQTSQPTISPMRLLDINEIPAGQALTTQFQPNISLVPVPFQLLVFDQNGQTFNPAMLTYDGIGSLPSTREDINQLPTVTITPTHLSVAPSCAICLENFDPSSEVKQLPTCHHIFHTNCLTQWLLHHSNCPMCRTRISSTHQTSLPIFTDQWLPQLFFQTIGQQQTTIPSINTIVPYSPIKIINPPQISSELETLEQSSNDTLQLPRFDSQTHPRSSANTD